MQVKPLNVIYISLFSMILALSVSFVATANQYEEIDWVELIPQDDLDALLNPPAYLDEIEDGSFEDQIANDMLSALEMSGDDRYQQALVSTKVVEDYNARAIRLPGFIVPVEMNEKQQVTEFFLVPYFGACIHYPPPPPNQIIYVTVKDGLSLNDIQQPYWVEGKLSTTLTENELAISAYSLKADNIILYTEDY